MTAAEMQRLIQELQIHQIELEMQNEELKQARDEAEAERERYLDLYDFAPVGYFTLGADGAIRQVNLAGARLLGLERSALLNRRFCHFVSEADVAAFERLSEEGLREPREGELRRFAGQSGAATLPCPDRGSRLREWPGMPGGGTGRDRTQKGGRRAAEAPRGAGAAGCRTHRATGSSQQGIGVVLLFGIARPADPASGDRRLFPDDPEEAGRAVR